MEICKKLKLLRGLNALSQSEMALLAVSKECSYSALEEERCQINYDKANSLASAFNVDPEWILGSSNSPLRKTGFAIFAFSGTKVIGSSKTTQDRRQADSIKNIKSFLPLLFKDASIQLAYSGKTDNDKESINKTDQEALYFVLFDSQGLLLRISDSQDLLKELDLIWRGFECKSFQEVILERDFFARFDNFAPTGVMSFVKSITANFAIEKAFWEKVVSAVANFQKKDGKERGEKHNLVTIKEAIRIHEEQQYQKRVKRISQEIMDNHVRVEDIIVFLKNSGRTDLLSAVIESVPETVNVPD